MGWSRWRKDRYENKERDILIEGAITGSAETWLQRNSQYIHKDDLLKTISNKKNLFFTSSQTDNYLKYHYRTAFQQLMETEHETRIGALD